MNLESSSVYDNLPENSGLIEHYKPKFLARGGDHLVYTVEDHPDMVVKASTFKIKDILHENAKNNQPLDSLSEDQKTKFEKEIFDKNLQITQLREFFGREHTLSEKRYLMKIPVSNEVLREIFKDDWKKRQPPINSQTLIEAWASVAVQKKSEEILDPDHNGLSCGGFLEDREYKSSDYKELNNKFCVNPTHDQEDRNVFFNLQDNPEIHAISDLLTLAVNDQGLRELMQELNKKMINYAENTGNILALAGKDNIIFYRKNDLWNYLLVDALTIHDEPVLHFAREAIHKYLNNEQLTDHEKILIIKALNFTRIVNGLALCLDIEERLNIISDEDLGKDLDFAKLLKG